VPIVKFVNLVLQQAVQDRASDIHFEPFESEFASVTAWTVRSMKWRAAETSRAARDFAPEIMANLNILGKTAAQDGRINYQMGSKQIDLRMSTLPTQFGESVVLRVLDRSSVNWNWSRSVFQNPFLILCPR